jgi:hypothetical protein
LWLIGQAPFGTQECVKNGVNLATRFVNTTHGRDHALTRFTAIISIRLSELNVSMTARTGDFDVHANSVASKKLFANTYDIKDCQYKSLQSDTLTR